MLWNGDIMDNFIFNARTKIYFGKGQVDNLPDILNEFGKNVLLVYGGSSIKKNGIYNQITERLSGFSVCELSGVEPNPKIESVRAGAELAKKKNVDVVLAVGGGSVIDCAKSIAAGYYYDGDPWDFVKDSSLIGDVLPVVAVLTIAATGSEMNKNSVISNMASNEKLCTSSLKFIPRAAILDPTYTYTVPAYHTAAGVADIMSHVFENYFKSDMTAGVQDGFSEAILKTCIKYAKKAIDTPDDYEARANLMWASTMALNGLCGAGKSGSFSCHPMEHELSAFYDITHGVGLAILTPRWFRYILSENTVDLFYRYAVNVWGICDEDKFAAADKAIDATYAFFEGLGIPMNLSKLGIDGNKFEIMAKKACANGLSNAYVPLSENDVVNIFNMCV